MIVHPKATLRDCFFSLCRSDRAAPLMIGGIMLLAHIDLPGAKAKKSSDSIVCSCLVGRLLLYADTHRSTTAYGHARTGAALKRMQPACRVQDWLVRHWLMREALKPLGPPLCCDGEGRGTTVLSLCCKSTDTLRRTDENRQREHVHHRNLWSGVAAIP